MRRLLVFIAIVVLGIAHLPLSVQAADTCSCFCGNPGVGAYQPYTDPVSQTTCAEMCGEAGHGVLGCYTSRDQWPDKSEMCWTQTECTSMGTDYEWDDYVANCYDTPVSMGYCYSPQKAVTLLQPFGGNTAFSGIPEYVSAVYKYIVPVMAMIAVVMLMVSGMQYILARGNAEQIKKAKSRITGAITGLILLMSAWTIANVLDPQLVNLKQLRIPTQKKVVLLDPATTCEYLASVGFGISTTSGGTPLYGEDVKGDCGKEGYVADLEKVNANIVTGSWEEGSKCNYKGCAEGTSCTNKQCLSCVVASGQLDSVSPDICESFQSPTAGKGDNEVLCAYVEEKETDAWGFDLGAICVQSYLPCQELISEEAGCRDYDEVIIAAASSWGSYTAQADEGMTAAQFAQFCQADYCGLAGSTGRTCMISPKTNGFDCVSSADNPEVTAEGTLSGMGCLNNGGVAYDCEVGKKGSP